VWLEKKKRKRKRAKNDDGYIDRAEDTTGER
jgi:hypothetical protein